MIKKIFFSLIFILYVFSVRSQNNSAKGLFYIRPLMQEGDYYFRTMAFEKKIFKKVAMQISYSDAEEYDCSGGTGIKMFSPELRYYFYVDKKINCYATFYDEYFKAYYHGYGFGYDTVWNDDNTYDTFFNEIYFSKTYFLNGLGLGAGAIVKLSERAFFDFQLSPRYFVHTNDKNAFRKINNNLFIPFPPLDKFDLNFNLMFGFKLF